MSLLRVNDLTVRYDDSVVVDHVSFSIERGESVGMVGESGSGKSQTAMSLLGLLTSDASISGSVRLDGKELLGKANAELNRVRADRIGFVFQDSTQALNPYLRIGQQLQQVLLKHKVSKTDAAARVTEMLQRVGLPDPLRQFRAYPHELSGGMRQRVMIAAALIAKPDLLIADEPTTALDVTVQAQILELLEALRDDTALLLITHDLGIVASRCERVLVMHEGKLVEANKTAALFSAPQQTHTKALLAASVRLDTAAPPASVQGKSLLGVDGAAITYRDSEKRAINAVVDVSMTLREGETVAIVGESGSGKSSLVRGLLGLIPMRAGRVVYAGKPLGGPVEKRSLRERRDLQLVFQDPIGALNPQMRVASIVGEPLLVHEAGMRAKDRNERVLEVLQTVGIDASLAGRFPHQLSGGQAQRVAIARALIMRPSVLICDEAVAALDGAARQQVLELLRAAQASTGLAILFISHDLAVVRSMSHRALVMYLGRLLEVGDCDALFNTPRHPYTRALIDAVPVPDPRVALQSAPLLGEIPSPANPPGGCVFHPRCRYQQAACIETAPALRDVCGSRVACHRADELNLY